MRPAESPGRWRILLAAFFCLLAPFATEVRASDPAVEKEIARQNELAVQDRGRAIGMGGGLDALERLGSLLTDHLEPAARGGALHPQADRPHLVKVGGGDRLLEALARVPEFLDQ